MKVRAVVAFAKALKERKMFTIEVSHSLEYSCVIFLTFIHTLCGLCEISEDYPEWNCISCLDMKLFFRILLMLSSGTILEYPFPHLTILVLFTLRGIHLLPENTL
jgi:hypothetical protein